MKRFLVKFFGIAIIMIIIMVAILLIWGTVNDYRPSREIIVDIEGFTDIVDTIDSGDTLTFLSWNIGYGGLGSAMDFFYDGGNKVMPSEPYYQFCFSGIKDTLQQNREVDFIMLQEVDQCAKRSYGHNQVAAIAKVLPDHFHSFALNYNVSYVPVPMFRPMGRVVSGVMTLSKKKPVSSLRIAYPGSYSWPKRIFMLDRCFIISKYPLSNEKMLVVLNTHNSAFDKEGKLRKQEYGLIRKYMLREYEQGNYVIAGGDWNTNPTDFSPEDIVGDTVMTIHPPMDNDFMPEGWVWAIDNTTGTNREVKQAYTKGKTPVTIIDFFIMSPNIKLLGVTTREMGFAFSDHQPVLMKVVLL